MNKPTLPTHRMLPTKPPSIFFYLLTIFSGAQTCAPARMYMYIYNWMA